MSEIKIIKANSTVIINGTQADHTVIAFDEILTMEKYQPRREELWKWMPETSYGHKSIGRAIGWLKRQIQNKSGWRESSQWEIWKNLDNETFSVYKIRGEKGL